MKGFTYNDDDFQSAKPTGSLGDKIMYLAQILVLVIFTFCTEYSTGVAPSPTSAEDTGNAAAVNLYPMFQDVNVMIFIGFGFLMTYIKAQGQSALAFTWIVSIWCIQWGILSQAWFISLIKGQPLGKIPIDLNSLINGLFGAATAMISYGALLGKCSIQQLLFLTMFEMIFWGLNWAICLYSLKAVDMGGSIIIHVFGCYYGLAASWWFQPDRAAKSNNNSSNHNSEIIALIGSIFLWLYWPSFNGATAAQGDEQQRVICNTNLSIGAGCVAASLLSRIYYGKLEMTIVMNATLAGGVAIGTASNLVSNPSTAMWIGFIAGSWSAFGFDKLNGYFADKINLQDTCGVNWLHGTPGIIGGLASFVVLSSWEADNGNFGATYNSLHNPQ